VVLKISTEEAAEFEPNFAAGFHEINRGTRAHVPSSRFPHLSLFKAELKREKHAFAYYVTDPENIDDAWSYLFVRPKTIAGYATLEAFSAYTEDAHRSKGLGIALHCVTLDDAQKPLASDEKGMTVAAHNIWVNNTRPWRSSLLTVSSATVGPVGLPRSSYFHRRPDHKDTVLLIYLAAMGQPQPMSGI
jgi:hypothetical protein